MMNDVPLRATQSEFYQSEMNVRGLLAAALSKGHLRLVLGAGVSIENGLPNWSDLISRISMTAEVNPVGNDDSAKSDWLLRHAAQGDRVKFAELVRCALYEKYDQSIIGLARRPLILALGALSMAGMRGGVTEVVTFNFDDLLEQYLRYCGFVVQSITNLPALSTRSDVQVLHIHGLLPSDSSEKIPREIVFTQSDFDLVVGDKLDFWNQRVSNVMRSNLCIFIGLSGNDPNLRSILAKVKSEHALSNNLPYWGIRLNANEDCPQRDMFEDYGVFQITMPHVNYGDWMLKIAQHAAKLHN